VATLAEVNIGETFMVARRWDVAEYAFGGGLESGGPSFVVRLAGIWLQSP